ncbi:MULTISPECIES: roadblock/LC7 domain-containing protein [Nocardia]|uniref:roadblock/LC7 domain-containing protein n=1 Tax=Nocardia TaxID=1817 RepID=UPI001E40F4D7|nr:MULTISPECIES: roadblock/LC7 domain-containing protein [Nocardia]
MTPRRKLLGDLMGRLTKVPMREPGPNPAVQAELAGLRARVPGLIGALVASSDGLLVTHDLPGHIEPTGMAALAAAQLSLSNRLAGVAHGGGFQEVVVDGSRGHVVIYAAGWASLTVLAEPDVNIGRLHLESRPAARTIAEHLAGTAREPGRTDARPG